jgi:hemolysin D
LPFRPNGRPTCSQIEQEQELRVQQSRTNELSAAVLEQRHAIEATAAQFRREQLDALNQAQQQLPQLAAEETKATQRAKRMDLRAPVDGTVIRPAAW